MKSELAAIGEAIAQSERSRIALMAQGRRGDVAALLAARRVERYAASMAVLAREGFFVEVQAMGRSFLDAFFSAALLLDSDETVRIDRSQRFARGILATQIASAQRYRQSKIEWLRNMYDEDMARRHAELEQTLGKLGGLPTDKKHVDHWFGNRREVAKTVGMEDAYESLYQEWTDATHSGAFATEEMFRFDEREGRVGIDDAAGRAGALRALRIAAAYVIELAKGVRQVAEEK